MTQLACFLHQDKQNNIPSKLNLDKNVAQSSNKDPDNITPPFLKKTFKSQFSFDKETSSNKPQSPKITNGKRSSPDKVQTRSPSKEIDPDNKTPPFLKKSFKSQFSFDQDAPKVKPESPKLNSPNLVQNNEKVKSEKSYDSGSTTPPFLKKTFKTQFSFDQEQKPNEHESKSSKSVECRNSTLKHKNSQSFSKIDKSDSIAEECHSPTTDNSLFSSNNVFIPWCHPPSSKEISEEYGSANRQKDSRCNIRLEWC